MKKLLAIVFALCSCVASKPQGQIVKPETQSSVRANALYMVDGSLQPMPTLQQRIQYRTSQAATSTSSDCFMANDPPNFLPYCGGCSFGEGYKTDQACIQQAKNAWSACETAACLKYQARVAIAAARRDHKLELATDAYFACMLAANHDPAAEQICFDTALAATTAAHAAYDQALAAFKMMYAMEVANCDMAYMLDIDECCIPCDPWDGWPE